MGANLVVILGIVFAYLQFGHIQRAEKTQTAITAVNQTRSSDFLKAYARIKTEYVAGKRLESTMLVDDLNLVMNTYDSIALLYMNDLADKCVIKNATYTAAKELSSIVDSFSYPKEYRVNFDRFVSMMNAEVCN